jgi:hypothetical protein
MTDADIYKEFYGSDDYYDEDAIEDDLQQHNEAEQEQSS